MFGQGKLQQLHADVSNTLTPFFHNIISTSHQALAGFYVALRAGDDCLNDGASLVRQQMHLVDDQQRHQRACTHHITLNHIIMSINPQLKPPSGRPPPSIC